MKKNKIDINLSGGVYENFDQLLELLNKMTLDDSQKHFVYVFTEQWNTFLRHCLIESGPLKFAIISSNLLNTNELLNDDKPHLSIDIDIKLEQVFLTNSQKERLTIKTSVDFMDCLKRTLDDYGFNYIKDYSIPDPIIFKSGSYDYDQDLPNDIQLPTKECFKKPVADEKKGNIYEIYHNQDDINLILKHLILDKDINEKSKKYINKYITQSFDFDDMYFMFSLNMSGIYCSSKINNKNQAQGIRFETVNLNYPKVIIQFKDRSSQSFPLPNPLLTSIYDIFKKNGKEKWLPL